MKDYSHIPVDTLLIGKYLAGEASPEEAMAIHAWREKSQANLEAYDHIAVLWNMSDPQDQYQPPLVSQAWEQWSHRRDTATWQPIDVASPIVTPQPTNVTPPVTALRPVAAPSLSLFSGARLGIAAAVLLLIAGISAFLLFSDRTGSKSQDNIVLAAGGKITTDTLPDQSAVVLTKGSRLTCSRKFSGNQRVVLLDGEGYFSIKPKPLRPFVVKTGDVNIIVLGTEFNVKVDSASVKVQVNVGKVMMYNAKDSLILKAGLTGIYDTKSRTFQQVDTVHKNDFAYATKALYFSDLSMSEVAKQIETAYDIRIVFENNSIMQCRLNTQFKDQPLKDVLEIISASLNIQYRQKKDTVYFYGHGCND